MFMTIMPKSLTVMQGIPASGKSTMARTILDTKLSYSGVTGGRYTGQIFSTDDFWVVDNVYRYDPAKAAEAHAWNQRRVVSAMQDDLNYIVVDNTNIQKWQAQPYFNLASMFGYGVQVVSVSCGLDEALRRNKSRPFDRRIPEDVMRRMHGDLEPLL